MTLLRPQDSFPKEMWIEYASAVERERNEALAEVEFQTQHSLTSWVLDAVLRLGWKPPALARKGEEAMRKMTPEGLRIVWRELERSRDIDDALQCLELAVPAWEADIQKGANIATELARQLRTAEARIEALENTKALLRQAAIALRSVPDKAVFGIGGEGITHWYIVDELLSRIDAVLAKEEP